MEVIKWKVGWETNEVMDKGKDHAKLNKPSLTNVIGI
jgi:hypothetical protein